MKTLSLTFLAFLAFLTLVMLAIPPRSIAWVAKDSELYAAEMQPDQFAGWHEWSFAKEGHNQTIGADVGKKGETVGYVGTHVIAYDILLAEFMLLTLMFIIIDLMHAHRETIRQETAHQN